MDIHHRSLRLGAAVILCALILRLHAGGAFRFVAQWLQNRDVQAFLIYLETGRTVRFSPSYGDGSNSAGESPPPQIQQSPEALPCFGPEEISLVDIRYSCSLRPDLERLLQTPLEWDLTGPEPKVLILHTHATESYTKNGENYTETSAFRTLDEGYNMLSIGDAVAEILEANGIAVIHDRTLHDYPSYNGSYTQARKTIAKHLEAHPEVCLVLDLHRDASGDLNNQFRTLATVDGAPSAQLMLVMGTNASGQAHGKWEENLALGLKLQVVLEQTAPGITRPISLRAQRFNQDMTTGSLLIEVGSAGNSHTEALRAARILGEAIVSLAKGSGESGQ